jgi:hypothetical protein
LCHCNCHYHVEQEGEAEEETGQAPGGLQGDFMENSVLESLRKAEVAVNNFLRSNPYLMMRLGKHQEVCEAAIDIEQEDFTKNFGFESLRKADIMVGNFLRSDHSTYGKSKQMSENVEMISEEQQLTGVYKITSNAEGFNMGSIDNEIPEPEVFDVNPEEPDTDTISKTVFGGMFDKPVVKGESASREIVSQEPSNLECSGQDSSPSTPSLLVESVEEDPI